MTSYGGVVLEMSCYISLPLFYKHTYSHTLPLLQISAHCLLTPGDNCHGTGGGKNPISDNLSRTNLWGKVHGYNMSLMSLITLIWERVVLEEIIYLVKSEIGKNKYLRRDARLTVKPV